MKKRNNIHCRITSSYLKRLELIRNQLSNKCKQNSNIYSYNPLNEYKNKTTFDKEILEKLYFPFDSHKEFRDKIFNIMKAQSIFRIQTYHTEMNSSQIKELYLKQMKLLVKEVSKIIPFVELRKDPIKFGIMLECVNHYDLGLAVKFAVQTVLYYNSILYLGTHNHSKYLNRCLEFDDLGCFALTELGHGSNVRAINTTAIYDQNTNEFILNSPSYQSYKWWIGGAGRTANMAIIFAQLITKEIKNGIHAFIVPIRDKLDHLPFPGVILGDTGPKVGNEGLDNGFIGFLNYRIPREALLNKFSQVSEEGEFSSIIKNPDVRFATALGALSEGRIGVSITSQAILANGITIAGRYSFLRKQFSIDLEGKEEEQPIISYPSTQIRLIPAIAELFAFRAACFDLGTKWINILPYVTETKNPLVIEAHALISALKPYVSSVTQLRLQQFRELMGGHGYSRFNLIGGLRNNNDINTTWEGDNTVLVQQTAKFILDNFRSKMKGKSISNEYKTLRFLDRFGEPSSDKLVIKKAEDFNNFESLQSIFERRISVNLVQSLQKLSEEVEKNKNPLIVAWNNSQVFYLQPLVKTYTEYYIFNSFKERIDTLDESSTKLLLIKLLKLFSLSIFEADLATLRYDDFITSDLSYVIKEEILKLCECLKNDLLSIIDIISAPDEILNAPMGSSDGKIWERYLGKVFSFNGCFERIDWWENIHLNGTNSDMNK